MARVAVAMSGGVDSAVAAALLVAEGHEVVGITMNLWPTWVPQTGEGSGCCGIGAIDDARSVARHLGIRHYVLNLRSEFEREVITYFASEYARGRTPNPCIACNKAIKFDLLLRKALGLRMQALATGHYARVDRGPDGRSRLLRAADPQKDQSYVLAGLTQEQLAYLRFPVGAYTKAQIRDIARRHGLSVAGKPDSQEICFVPDGDYAAVVARVEPEALRHASADIPAVIAPAPGGRVAARFETWPRAAAPGQAIAFYDGEVVLGGGVIDEVRMGGPGAAPEAAPSAVVGVLSDAR